MNKEGITYKKLLLVGDREVGKTCFINKLKNDNFINQYSRTECNLFI